MSVPAICFRISDGEIVVPNGVYPKEDLTPITDGDPAYQWLIKTTPQPEPDRDSRIFILDKFDTDLKGMVANNQLNLLEDHPLYPGVKQYQRTYVLRKRANEAIELAIDNAEAGANDELTTFKNNEKLFMLSAGVQIKRARGLSIGAEELAIEDQVLEFEVKMWKNDNEKKNKKQQLADGLTPDIDAGWERGANPIL
jgi:hypothetical protein